MKIQELIKQYSNLEIELLLMKVLKKSKEFLYMNPEYILPSKHLNILSKLIKRRQAGEPMAYILGYKDFMGLKFKVNKDVLIPRPETEMVVESVVQGIALLQSNKNKQVTDQPVNILDVGTGSGCIAISLYKLLSNASKSYKFPSPWAGAQSRRINFQISAIDISPTALKIAKQNAKKLIPQFSHTPVHGRIEFVKSDLLSSFKLKEAKSNSKQEFDIIVANLPYGWYGVKNRFSSVKDGLKFEPKLALYTQEQGLYEIHRLLDQIKLLKYLPKFIFLEFDPRQKKMLEKLVKQIFINANCKFYKDYRKLWRVCKIEL